MTYDASAQIMVGVFILLVGVIAFDDWLVIGIRPQVLLFSGV